MATAAVRRARQKLLNWLWQIERFTRLKLISLECRAVMKINLLLKSLC